MANFPFSALREEYAQLWDRMKINAGRTSAVNSILNKIRAHRHIYLDIEKKTNVPWFVIAAIHSRESSLNFATHLHCGDPLSSRTIHVPRGRPAAPPANGMSYTFVESAVDALTMAHHELHKVQEWSIERILYELERYNGWGYRSYHPGTKSPYVWSFSNNYISGKYVADGKWSATAVDQQCGTAAIIQALALSDPEVAKRLGRSTTVDPEDQYDTKWVQEALNDLLIVTPALEEDGLNGPKTKDAVRAFQRKHGQLKVDGIAGDRTIDALKVAVKAMQRPES